MGAKFAGAMGAKSAGAMGAGAMLSCAQGTKSAGAMNAGAMNAGATLSCAQHTKSVGAKTGEHSPTTTTASASASAPASPFNTVLFSQIFFRGSLFGCSDRICWDLCWYLSNLGCCITDWAPDRILRILNVSFGKC